MLIIGQTGSGDEATMMSFFSASKDANGNYYQNSGERIPPNWRARTDPYDGTKVGLQIVAMYLEHVCLPSPISQSEHMTDNRIQPVLFGGNVGKGNFNALNLGSTITNGTFNPQTGSDALCLIYQLLTGGIPSEVGQLIDIPVALETAIAGKLNPMFANFGCPLNYNSGSSVSGN